MAGLHHPTIEGGGDKTAARVSLALYLACLFVFCANINARAAALTTTPDIDYKLEISIWPVRHLHVTLSVVGGSQGFTILGSCINKGTDLPDCDSLIQHVVVRSSTGSAIVVDHPSHSVWTVDNRLGEQLLVSYDVFAASSLLRSAYSPRSLPRAFVFFADGALMVPEHLLSSKSITICYRWAGLSSRYIASSSFGLDERSNCIRVPAAQFLSAFFATSSRDDMSILSSPHRHIHLLYFRPFPPSVQARALAVQLEAVNTALQQYLGDADGTGKTFVLLPVHHSPVNASTYRSTVVIFIPFADIVSRKSSDIVHLLCTVSHELVHTHSIGRIMLPASTTYPLIVSEGAAEFIGRRALFRAHLISANDVAVEISTKLGIYNDSLSKRLGGTNNASTTLAAGDIMMVSLDAQLRTAGIGSQDVLAVLNSLVDHGVDSGQYINVDESTFIHIVEARTSKQYAEQLDAFVNHREPIFIEDKALEPCSHVTTASTRPYDLGFDLSSSINEHRIEGVTPSGPAWKVGLRDGQTLLTWDIAVGRSDTIARLTVGDKNGRHTFSYYPTGDDSAAHQAVAVVLNASGDGCSGVF